MEMVNDTMGLVPGPSHNGVPTKFYNGVQLQYWSQGGNGHPMHGDQTGHLIPGCFFVFWSGWWLFSVFRLALRASPKKPYTARGWFDWPTWVPWDLPVEPIMKMLLPAVGIIGELWAEENTFQSLYGPDRKFDMHRLPYWQHTTMYTAFIVSGCMDLLGCYTRHLPPGTDQAYLGLAFIVEGLLFAFHLKGTPLDFTLHLLLVITVFATAAVIFAELANPQSLLLSLARCGLVMLQGIWFIQTGAILYAEYPQWDPTYMGSSMVVPVYYCFYALVVAFTIMTAFVAVKTYQQWSTSAYLPVKANGGEWDTQAVELSRAGRIAGVDISTPTSADDLRPGL